MRLIGETCIGVLYTTDDTVMDNLPVRAINSVGGTNTLSSK